MSEILSSSLDLETRNSQGKFEDFDLLERGDAQEIKKDDFALKPAIKALSWTKCYVVTDKETKSISMYRDNDDNDFLFTAVQHKSSFFISQYQSFPKQFKKMKDDHARRNSTVAKLTESVLSVARRSFNSDTAPGEQSMSNSLNKSLSRSLSGSFSFGGDGESAEETEIESKAFIMNQTNGKTRYHAKLIANSDSSFTLYSTRCEYCDKVLRRYSCGGVLAPYNECRQRLADIRHGLVRIKGVDGVEARRLHCVIPQVLDKEEAENKGIYRIPWCPRVKKEFVELLPPPVDTNAKIKRSESDPEGVDGSEEKGNKKADLQRSKTDTDMNSSSSEDDKSQKEKKDKSISFESRLPEWNDDAGSLVLTFQDGRVREPSAKNFLLTKSGSKTKYLIQFGKVKNGKYNLDFKNPVAPLQAFGIALSAFSWKLENPNTS